MKFNLKNYTLLFYLVLIAPLASMEEPLPLMPPKKMGAELETHSIKTNMEPGAGHAGFTIHDMDDRELWCIEQDTADARLKETENSSFSTNLEIKTIGGYDSEESFIKVLSTMTNLLKDLFDNSFNALLLNYDMLNRMISAHTHEKFYLTSVDPKIEKFEIISLKEDENNTAVRPQITYQLKFSDIPFVFERLASLKHKVINDFLAPLKEGYKNRKISKEPPNKEEKHKNNKNIILNYFNEKLSGKIMNCSKNVKGFSYLFLFYWLQIFNNSELLSKLKEPGLKPFLGVMSRIPFSQMYDLGLSSKEQKEFREIFDEIINTVGAKCKAKRYFSYKEEEIDPQLSLKDWYESIVDTEKRGEKYVRKHIDINKDLYEDVKVDSLSPPARMPLSYSMGLIHWNVTGCPLIEVRGYANLTHEGKSITFDNVKDFIMEEARWFFETLK